MFCQKVKCGNIHWSCGKWQHEVDKKLPKNPKVAYENGHILWNCHACDHITVRVFE